MGYFLGPLGQFFSKVMGYFFGPLGHFFPRVMDLFFGPLGKHLWSHGPKKEARVKKWPPYFWKPWMSPYVAAGAFFFSEKWPPDFSIVMGLFCGPLGKIFWSHGPLFWTPRPIFDDFLKTKKMRNVCTINLAAVSRRDLYYVSENESFCFGQNISISRPRARLGLRGWG